MSIANRNRRNFLRTVGALSTIGLGSHEIGPDEFRITPTPTRSPSVTTRAIRN